MTRYVWKSSILFISLYRFLSHKITQTNNTHSTIRLPDSLFSDLTIEECPILGPGPGQFLDPGAINALEVLDDPVGMTGGDLLGLDRQGNIF